LLLLSDPNVHNSLNTHLQSRGSYDPKMKYVLQVFTSSQYECLATRLFAQCQATATIIAGGPLQILAPNELRANLCLMGDAFPRCSPTRLKLEFANAPAVNAR